MGEFIPGSRKKKDRKAEREIQNADPSEKGINQTKRDTKNKDK